jgi:hypothetical protein
VHFGHEEIGSVTDRLAIGIAKKRRIRMTRIQEKNPLSVPFSMVSLPPFVPIPKSLVKKASIFCANFLGKMTCKISPPEFL